MRRDIKLRGSINVPSVYRRFPLHHRKHEVRGMSTHTGRGGEEKGIHVNACGRQVVAVDVFFFLFLSLSLSIVGVWCFNVDWTTADSACVRLPRLLFPRPRIFKILRRVYVHVAGENT